MFSNHWHFKGVNISNILNMSNRLTITTFSNPACFSEIPSSLIFQFAVCIILQY
jgi:hypothetical protein